jgi:tetracycline resistance efflux pump
MISIIPAIIVIILTLKTKKLIISLIAGILIGTLILKSSVINGFLSIGGYITTVLSDRNNAYTLGFLILFSSLAELMKMAGGISGFSSKVESWAKTERSILGWSWLLSIITFFDSTFHRIAVGTILMPLFEKTKGSKQKFAFVLSVTSLQLIMLTPIATGYLGYMVSLVSTYSANMEISQSPYLIVVKSMLWNFFSWSMLLIAFGVTLFGLGFGKIKIGKDDGGKGLSKGHIEKEEKIKEEDDVQEFPKKSLNLVLPVIILLTTTLFFFWWTGKGTDPSFFRAISSADFSASIFTGALLTLIISCVIFLFQKIGLAEIEAHVISGAEKILSLIIILILSWVLIKITQDLGFNKLISENLINSVPKFLIPPMIFLIAAAISYSIGSSWATWALIMPLAVSFSKTSGVDFAMMVGTVWAGGAVTDVISPLTAEISKIPYGEHLTTSLPYIIFGVLLSLVGYLVVGLLLT